MSTSPVRVAVRRVGVFGGAFDPPHRAHIALAKAAVAHLQLDELHVIPTGQAWHKAAPLSPARHRLAMAQLAFSDVPQAVIDPRETHRSGPSYTVDTLRELKVEYPDDDLYLILGEDQARALPGWLQHLEVIRLAIICVAERDKLTGDKPLFNSFKTHASRFRRLQMPAMPVSSTEIRTRVAAQQSVEPLVFESVARYIDDHHLYQTT